MIRFKLTYFGHTMQRPCSQEDFNTEKNGRKKSEWLTARLIDLLTATMSLPLEVLWQIIMRKSVCVVTKVDNNLMAFNKSIHPLKSIKSRYGKCHHFPYRAPIYFWSMSFYILCKACCILKPSEIGLGGQ